MLTCFSRPAALALSALLPSPPSRFAVPLELRACLLERASSSPAIRLPHYSSIARIISPMTVLLNFLSASNNGCNPGSPRVVVLSLQTLDSHHASRKIAARLITPMSASDLAVGRTSSSLVFLIASPCFLFFSGLGFFEARLLFVAYLITLYWIFFYFGCTGRIRVSFVLRRYKKLVSVLFTVSIGVHITDLTCKLIETISSVTLPVEIWSTEAPKKVFR